METGTRAARPDAESRIAAVLRGCEGRAVTPGDDGYPGRLLLLRSPPSVVYLAGSWRLDVPAVAIVGARASNGDGEDFARSLAAELASSGISVLSGLARGIDAAAHAGALDAGGRSGAVLGTGLDRAYPRANARLQARLRDSIGLLTEVPPGHAPRPSTFASRNRLLAALSDAVVLVQGRGDSGALITAREARDLGRPVGAVPWDPRDPLAEAPLGLLRAGRAELVRHAGDVLELMGCAALRSPDSAGAGPALPEDGARAVSLAPGGDEARLLAALRRRPEPLDVAAARAGLTLAAAGAAFVVLELHGLAETAPGGLARRARTG